jgi:hypothetical protein
VNASDVIVAESKLADDLGLALLHEWQQRHHRIRLYGSEETLCARRATGAICLHPAPPALVAWLTVREREDLLKRIGAVR